MGRLALGCLVLLTVSLFSCQKELPPLPSDTDTKTDTTPAVVDTPVVSQGLLLVKLVQNFKPSSGSSTQTVTTLVTWNSNKQITSYALSGTSNGTAVSATYTFTRNSGGVVTKAVESNFPVTNGYDSIVHTVTYQSGSTTKLKYVTSLQYASGLGYALSDSVIYTYDGNGRVSQKETYFGLLGTLIKSSRETYTYDASGNMTKQVVAAWDSNSSSYVTSSTYTFAYSSHKSMVQLGIEAFIVPLQSLASPDYYTTYSARTESATISNDYSNTTYNSSDMPAYGTVTQTSATSSYNGSISFTATYQ